jgi:hypothetical protein
MQIGAGLIGEFGGYKAKGGGYELFFMASTNYYYHRKTRLCQCLGASVKIVAIDWACNGFISFKIKKLKNFKPLKNEF